jgi:acetolactate synthase-1/2/3 large subunit
MAGKQMEMTGAEMVLQALKDNGVEHIFGYPGGAVLPIYDELHQQDAIEHILVRHEQGAGHMAEGYARSTGKPGVVLVTSGPGATNVVTALQDALMDSIPLVCLTGQVPTSLIGSDAFQECDTVGITRPCTKHNWLVKDVNQLSRVIHEAFRIATTGRPGPVVVDIPKDVQFATGIYTPPSPVIEQKSYQPKVSGDLEKIRAAIDLMAGAKRPIIYSGGGVINSGREASQLLRELVELTGFPITSTLMGLGAYPASGKNWMGMLGMHGTYEANMAMHDCDVMICIGARFDDRITGRLDAFSPNSKKIHIDIDPSSINKNVRTDIGILGDIGHVLEDMVRLWRASQEDRSQSACRLVDPDRQVEGPQLAGLSVQQGRDHAAIRDPAALRADQEPRHLHHHRSRPAPDVGGAVLWFRGAQPLDDIGRLGTMGYGFPAAVGVQVAHRDSLVIDIAGDASIQMCIQEMSCAVQYELPVKIFILNNQYMGMVRQWQQLLHGNRLSHSYTESMPDFVMLAEAYGGVGIRCDKPDDLDGAIQQMIDTPRPVIFDCRVAALANCFPMIPSGKAHNEMLLPDEATDEAVANAIDAKGRALV